MVAQDLGGGNKGSLNLLSQLSDHLPGYLEANTPIRTLKKEARSRESSSRRSVLKGDASFTGILKSDSLVSLRKYTASRMALFDTASNVGSNSLVSGVCSSAIAAALRLFMPPMSS